MCIRDSHRAAGPEDVVRAGSDRPVRGLDDERRLDPCRVAAVSYTHLRAHETVLDLVCRLLLEKKKLQHHS